MKIMGKFVANAKRRCKSCKEYYRPGEQPDFARWCSEKCREKLALMILNKQRDDRLKAFKRKKKTEAKKARKDLREFNRRKLSWQHEQTQRSFNKMRVLEEKLWYRERGLEPECISCGKARMDWCCGHFKSRGAHRELAYDRKNTWLQCNRYCNKGLSANLNGNKTTRGYLQGLKDRFGEEEGNAIIEYCESHHPRKEWTWQELEEMRKGFNARIRELEKLLE